MRCLACNVVMTEREASRKYENAEEIANPEERFIGLCSHCIKDTGLTYSENTSAKDTKSIYEEDDAEEVFFFELQDSSREV